MKKLSRKGMVGIGDVIEMGVAGIMLFIAIQLFLPFGDLLANATTNMPNNGVFMAAYWSIPLIMVGLVIWGFAQKAQSRE
jgi:hypothetical protein